ncbi:archease [uncultured Methanobrevibacter sp.]|uniref:archease n=1 Tax=uncultured Methanobrevibacter sp. TaxID=253161 RepID=UPI0026306214|nr:archease [uncultured Methanobrevibacter sp.]
MKKFEFFDVTADIGFYAYGNNLNEAFENAALALFNIISRTDNIEPIIVKSFEIESEDKVSLLYDFLEELLFLHEIEFMLFSQFEVTIDKINNGYQLNAVIKGEEINWDKHYRGDEVKAITFHKMNVIEEKIVQLSTIVDL